jgi:hypothetical protein
MNALYQIPKDMIPFSNGTKRPMFSRDQNNGNFICHLCQVKNINSEIGLNYHKLGDVHNKNFEQKSGFFDEDYFNTPIYGFEDANGKNIEK